LAYCVIQFADGDVQEYKLPSTPGCEIENAVLEVGWRHFKEGFPKIKFQDLAYKTLEASALSSASPSGQPFPSVVFM
jgi:hypothetical protein